MAHLGELAITAEKLKDIAARESGHNFARLSDVQLATQVADVSRYFSLGSIQYAVLSEASERLKRG